MPTILLVDDTPAIIEILKMVLQRYGYRVVVLYDGLKLLETLRQTQPALVLMDISLPFKDGWTLINEIRATADVAHVPVIALSGHCDESNRNAMLRAGYTDAIGKPFDVYELVQKIGFHAGDMRMCA